MQDEKEPNPVDVYVGSRLRMRRSILKISQTELGKRLGVTFQQIQKYEKGSNRISASKLYEICLALDVQVSYFYMGYSAEAEKVTGMAEAGQSSYDATHFSRADAAKLNMAFNRITKPVLRRQVIDLTKTLADETGVPE